MNKNYFRFAAFSMAVAIMLGALGAHALKSVLDSETLEVFKTGVRYQVWQTLAIFIIQFIPEKFLSQKSKNNICLLFVIGILLFSFSIYFLSLRNVLSLGGFTAILGPITPLGGLCFISGWIYLGIALFRKDSVK